MNLHIREFDYITNNFRDYFNNPVKILSDDTLITILERYKLPTERIILIHPNTNEYTLSLDYCYENGIVKVNYSPLKLKFKDFKEYGFIFKEEILLELNPQGLGFSGNSDLLIDFFENLNLWVSNNPIFYDIVKVALASTLPVLIKSISHKIPSYNIFKNSIRHKAEFDYDSFVKAYQLETSEKENNKKELHENIDIILSMMGFEYNKKRQAWIKKEIDPKK